MNISTATQPSSLGVSQIKKASNNSKTTQTLMHTYTYTLLYSVHMLYTHTYMQVGHKHPQCVVTTPSPPPTSSPSCCFLPQKYSGFLTTHSIQSHTHKLGTQSLAIRPTEIRSYIYLHTYIYICIYISTSKTAYLRIYLHSCMFPRGSMSPCSQIIRLCCHGYHHPFMRVCLAQKACI